MNVKLPYEIRMDKARLMEACMVGVDRHLESALGGHKPKVRQKPTDFNPDILGGIGEGAFSAATGIKWDKTVNTFKTIPDVGPYEIRCRSLHKYELYVRPDDPDERLYFCLTCEHPKLVLLHGHYVAGEAKQHSEWLHDHGNYGRAIYWVPHRALQTELTISLIEKEVERHRMESAVIAKLPAKIHSNMDESAIQKKLGEHEHADNFDIEF